jgi:XRE family transcriptional regulator, regulator of sulfur utilization
MVGDSLGDWIRRLREQRNLTLRALAEQTGFSPSFLSQVETGQASPSISSMERIATALGVTLGQFFHAAEGSVRPIIRGNARPRLSSQWSKAEIEGLGSGDPGVRLEPILVTLEPGATSGNNAHASTRDQFAFVLEGEVTLTHGLDEHVMTSGDSATIRSGIPRRWRNDSARPARVVIVEG